MILVTAPVTGDSARPSPNGDDDVLQSRPMTARRNARPPQVRPRAPSTGRPAPTATRSRAPSPTRLATHRRVERGPGIPLPFRLLMGVAVVALGVGVLLVASGGLGKVAHAIGTTFDGFVTDITATPTPAPTELVAADAPSLEAPDEPYTNVATVDLQGTVPTAVVGEDGVTIRIYVAIGKGDPGLVKEIPVGSTPRFLVPLPLSAGANTFTATLAGPGDLESEHSAAVTYVLDTSKPKITIASPKANATINATSAKVVGTTQARSTISVHNLTTNASVTGEADGKGAFTISVPIGTGSNKLQISATDPAGNANVATLTVQHGTGKLVAKLSATAYQVKLSKLPAAVILTVTVTDPDGRALPGANVTFTVAVPGVPAITSSVLSTGADGKVSFSTTLPAGATVGQCSLAAIVDTAAFGETTARSAIAIIK